MLIKLLNTGVQFLGLVLLYIILNMFLGLIISNVITLSVFLYINYKDNNVK